MATTLKELLDGLSVEERRLLMYAFEYDLTQYVILPNGRYLGVNASKVKYLVPDLSMSSGKWSTGDCKIPNPPKCL